MSDDITFTSTINGGQALALTAGADDVLVSGNAGGMTRLSSVTASGNTIGVQAVSTTGAQIYTGRTRFMLSGLRTRLVVLPYAMFVCLLNLRSIRYSNFNDSGSFLHIWSIASCARLERWVED